MASCSASWYRCSLVRSSSFAGRGAQRVQHPPDHLGALAGQVPVQKPGAAERGGQLHAAVGEVQVRVLVGPFGPGALVHLREQRRQLLQPQPPRRGDQGLVGLVPGLVRQLVRPQQISRPTGSETCPAASAASTRGWVRDPLSPGTVADRGARVIPVRWISQDTALYSASAE